MQTIHHPNPVTLRVRNLIEVFSSYSEPIINELVIARDKGEISSGELHLTVWHMVEFMCAETSYGSNTQFYEILSKVMPELHDGISNDARKMHIYAGMNEANQKHFGIDIDWYRDMLLDIEDEKEAA